MEDMKLIKAVYINEDETKRYTEHHGKKVWEARDSYEFCGQPRFGGWGNHREDGPAVILADGTEKYYQNGLLHREDGPASHSKDGRPMYRLKGKPVTAFDIYGENCKEGVWDALKYAGDPDGMKNVQNRKHKR